MKLDKRFKYLVQLIKEEIREQKGCLRDNVSDKDYVNATVADAKLNALEELLDYIYIIGDQNNPVENLTV